MYFEQLRSPADKDWCVVEEQFSVWNNRHYESVMALGTGYLVSRSSIEEGFCDDDQSVEYDRIPGNVTLEKIPETKNRYGTFMPVVQAKHPFWHIGIANLPYFLGLEISADGERLDLEQSSVTGYHRWLNLRTATLYRTFVWHTRSGKKLELLFTRFMDPLLKFCCVQECRLTMLEGNAYIGVTSRVDNDVRTNGVDVFSAHCVGSTGDMIYSDITTNLNGRVVTACRMMSDRCDSFAVSAQSRKITQTGGFRLAQGQEAVIKKVSAVVADAYFASDTLLREAEQLTASLLHGDTEQQHCVHKETWASNWSTCDIVIEADRSEGYNSQLAIRQAVYHLLRAKARDEDRGLICPKGLTSEIYIGSVFWDMEIFIQPFYIYTMPETARTTHMFRYRNLPAAIANGARYGYKGAKYPWMSSFNGEESCPGWEYADQQVHITSDVVIGLWHYCKATGDKLFLYRYGAEIILETARYWAQRVDKIPGKAGYQLYGVMGPDEYKPLSNNNAYTNYGARFNLRLACEVLTAMRQETPEDYERLCSKTGFAERELAIFREVADGLTICKDAERQIIWQCEDFDTAYATVDIDAVWQDKTKLFGLYVSQEKRYRSKIMKQSDVGALLGIFSEDFTKEEKAASLDYYAKYNTHDSSNSMCHQQIVSANIGRAADAYDAWKKSIDIDFGKYPRSSEGIHCANIGGMWQEVVFGFCGLVSALQTDSFTLRPCLPQQIHSISLRLFWKQNLVRLTLTDCRVELENVSGGELDYQVFACTGTLPPRQKVTLELPDKAHKKDD